ncbi:hypothetical protein GQ42DRAFT_162758 [Ramicandelaber brevisporus]|nr:hypothetical protein GQ42DRAFT_162758 [Ramicandelaber brevisporus]
MQVGKEHAFGLVHSDQRLPDYLDPEKIKTLDDYSGSDESDDYDSLDEVDSEFTESEYTTSSSEFSDSEDDDNDDGDGDVDSEGDEVSKAVNDKEKSSRSQRNRRSRRDRRSRRRPSGRTKEELDEEWEQLTDQLKTLTLMILLPLAGRHIGRTFAHWAVRAFVRAINESRS